MADVILVYLDSLEAAGGDDEEAARSATLLFETSVNAHVKAGHDRMTAKQLPGWYCGKSGQKWKYFSPDGHIFNNEASVKDYIVFCNTGSPSAAARAAFAHGFGPGWELFRMGKSWKCVSPEKQEFPSISATKKFLKALSTSTESTETTEPSPFSFVEAPSAVSRESEEAAPNAIRENQLKTDEIRILRTEIDQLKQKNSDLTIKTTVELEAVNEQFRKAEDHIRELEQNMKDLRQQSSELQTALQLETSARISQDTSIRTLTIDFQATSTENKELRSKVQELEARANGFVTTSYNPSAAWVSIKKQRIEPSATEVSVETKLAADAIDESRPQIAPPTHAWLCDKCGVAKFRTLSEANAHEDICSFVDTLSV